MVQEFWFRQGLIKVESFGFRLQSIGVQGFRALGVWARAQGLGFRDQGFGFSVQDKGLGFRAFRVQGLACHNLGLGSEVQGLGGWERLDIRITQDQGLGVRDSQLGLAQLQHSRVDAQRLLRIRVWGLSRQINQALMVQNSAFLVRGMMN